MALAPIVLFVYNRPWHTRQTLEALAKNELADQSELFIYADGPKENASEEQLKNIQEVREIIRENKWCKEVHIIESGKNKGLADSIICGVTEIINQFGKVIVLEDDIVTSKGFLKYMNEGLEYYFSDSFVAGISGFKYPSNDKICEVHFLPIASSWGWATWERQWSSTIFNSVRLLRSISNQKSESKFDFGYFPFLNILEEQVSGKVNSWAIQFYANIYLQKQCFVFPSVSMVQNIGFGFSGTHTTQPDNYMDKVIASTNQISFRKAKYDRYTFVIENSFKEKYCYSMPKKKKIRRSFFARIFNNT